MKRRWFYLTLLAFFLSLFALQPVVAQGFGADDPTLGGGPGGGTIGGGETPIGGGSGGGGTGGLGGDPCIGGGLGGGLGVGACCGDGVCEPGELCAADCSTCGDGVCSSTEDCGNCSTDCGSCGFCGDGLCNGTETCATCSDCSSCFPAPFQAFYRGESNRALRTAFSFNGTSWFGDNTLGNGASSKRSPAAVIFNNRIFLFYRGESNADIYVTWSDDGQVWSGNRQLGNGAETNEGVTAAVFNNRIYVFNKGNSSDAIWMSSSADGMTWDSADHRKIVSDSHGTDGAPAAIVFDGQLELHWRHNKYQVSHATSSDGQVWTSGAPLRVRSKDGVAPPSSTAGSTSPRPTRTSGSSIPTTIGSASTRGARACSGAAS
ncbi:MAG: hypothetical protein AAGM22_04345 [Acidobacteriota bacterium]